MVRSTFLRKATPAISSIGLCTHRHNQPRREDSILYNDLGEIIRERIAERFLYYWATSTQKSSTTRACHQTLDRISLPPEQNLANQSEEVLDNRELFLDFLILHDLAALNTLKAGPPEKQITYRSPGQANFEPPWSEHNFAQIDYVLTKTRWKNHFNSVEPRPTLDYDSDHLPITANMTVNWRFGTPPKPKPPTRHKRTTDDTIRTEYNQALIGKGHGMAHTTIDNQRNSYQH